MIILIKFYYYSFYMCISHRVDTSYMDFQAIWKQIDNPSLDASLRSQLLKGIENIYNKPPHTEVSILLGMKEYSPDEIRRMIFTPTE